MRILHVHDRLSARGGADLHLLAIASRQARDGPVDLAIGRADPGALAPPGVALHRVPGLGGREREAPAAARGIERLVARLRPDVVHLHNALQPEVMEAAARIGPSVATVQDHRAFCPGRGRLLPDERPCARAPGPSCAACFDDSAYAAAILALTARRGRALAAYDRIVVLSGYMARELAGVGLEPARIRVIPPFPWRGEGLAGVAVPGEPCLLGAGRLVRAKGFHVLLDACARVPEAPPVVLAGDGPARGDLERQARALGLCARFPGWCDRPTLWALLRAAHVFAMPSLWAEPFGIAGLEAAALGVAVIASRVGGIPEWLDEDAGWLVPPGDPGALAEALRAALTPGEAAGRGARGAARVARAFDPDRLTERLAGCYAEALAAH